MICHWFEVTRSKCSVAIRVKHFRMETKKKGICIEEPNVPKNGRE